MALTTFNVVKATPWTVDGGAYPGGRWTVDGGAYPGGRWTVDSGAYARRVLLGDERARIVAACRRMVADQLTVGTSGNVSMRAGDLVAITPSGAEYESLTPGSVCVRTLDGEPVDGPPTPSSELAMHTLVYRRTEAAAVVHTHSLYATALSTVVDELPPVHYLVALLGGPVRVAPYATYGSVELAEHSVAGLRGRYAVLLRNHGATCYGDTLDRAYQRALYLEWICRMYHQARLLGEPTLISPDELGRVAERLRSYPAPTSHPRRSQT